MMTKRTLFWWMLAGGLLVCLAGWAQSSPSPFAAHRIIALQKATPPLLSVEKRPIKIYVFGGQKHALERSAKSEYVFIFGGFHGDEFPGPFLVRRLMQVFQTNPELYADKKIFCVPEVNPDGVAAGRRVNARGVDLNRNFATSNYQAGQHKGSRYYAGPAALSEPESQIVEALIRPYLEDDYARERIKILSIHSPLKVNNYDGQGKKLALAMQAHNGYPATADIGYPTPGSFGTYYGNQHGRAIVTLETGAYSPETAWTKHKAALLAFVTTPLENAL